MTQDLLLTIDAGTIDWSRAQFALTAIYHWLFVPLTLGLAVIMGICETIYYKRRKALDQGKITDQSVVDFWQSTSKFWQRLFGINFAMGVATGIILEFEFGTNWSNYSWLVGDIFGAPLAIEGIVAFFMESTFVAVMFFGWKKVSAGFHLAATWLTGLGATLSAWWILVANAWMQYPVGCEFNPDTMRNEMVSFWEVALSPFAVDKFLHTVISAWIIGAVFCVAVCCWYLLKKRHVELAVKSIRIGAVVGLVAAVGAALTGHKSGQDVAEVQPMKLAAMEALYNGGTEQGLTMVAWVNPIGQPDYANEEEPALRIALPNALSLMATNTLDGYVPGINDILNGYLKADGTREPSADEKIARGKEAIAALQGYRQAKAAGDAAEAERQLKTFRANEKYFGYGYVRDKSELVPPIPINFWAFRAMVGLGCLLILFFGLVWVLSFKVPFLSVFSRRLLATLGLMPETQSDVHGATKMPCWLYIAAIVMVPLAYIASESGWLVAEFGRQPWTIQDMLPTWAAVSDLHSGSVMLTFFLFLILFTTMLAVEINIMLRQIMKGPEL
ncbi:MAG: cytochrome ubiquinol oxidase subunit I [Prevotella sp.]|nr:cytochrome ubiquinol oxidase subunit I [Prevotella sp.]